MKVHLVRLIMHNTWQPKPTVFTNFNTFLEFLVLLFKAPVKVLPWYTSVGTSEPLNKGVNDVEFRRRLKFLKVSNNPNSVSKYCAVIS